MNLEKLQNRKEELIAHSETVIRNMEEITKESDRVLKITQTPSSVIEDINNEFEFQTKLNKLDIAFLFFATALQCVRQYLITNFDERVDHKTAEKDASEAKKYLINRYKKGKAADTGPSRLYRATLNDICNGPVPFDIMYGSKDFNLGLGGTTHRRKTLGHDPVLGWIFGTSNIATNTITVWDSTVMFPPLRSYHVIRTLTDKGTMRLKISKKASTYTLLNHVKDELVDEGNKGKELIAYSLLKEFIHLKSDINSFMSLPFPLIHAVISPELAKTLTAFGLDTSNTLTVGKQLGYTEAINILIGMIHRLFYNASEDYSLSLYSIRTNKIITYSNMIASYSNILLTMFATFAGYKNASNYFDLGGLIVTIHKMIKDEELKNKIKEEFIKENFIKNVRGNSRPIIQPLTENNDKEDR